MAYRRDQGTSSPETTSSIGVPSYAPELNLQEGVWSLLKRSIANFVTADLTGLVRLIKRKLKKIQYRPELIAGCLAETGLIMDLPKVDTAATTSSI